MNHMKKTSMLLSLTVAGVMALASMAPASAAEPDAPPTDVEPFAVTCPVPDGGWPAPVVTLSNYKSDVYISGSLRVYGTGPATLSMSSGRSSTVTGTVGGSVSAEGSAIFAKVSATVSGSVAKSKTVTTQSTYSITVPSGKSMYIEVGAHGLGYRASVRKMSPVTCSFVTVAGDVKYPKTSGAIWYTQGTV